MEITSTFILSMGADLGKVIPLFAYPHNAALKQLTFKQAYYLRGKWFSRGK